MTTYFSSILIDSTIPPKGLCGICGLTFYNGNHTERWFSIDTHHKFKPIDEVIKERRKMSKLPQYRQGDVLLVPVLSLPQKTKTVPRDSGRLVLAYGEVTGHAHVIDAPPEEAVLLTDRENQRFLNLVKPANLVHEEHAAVQIPAGTYMQVSQEEWADNMERPDTTGQTRRVVD